MSTFTNVTAAAAIGFLGSIVASQPASAVIVSTGDLACPIGIPSTKTEIGANITCSKWDSTSFTLVGMSITITGQITGDISLTNKAAAIQSVKATTSSDFSFGPITGFTFSGLSLSFTTGTVNIPAGGTSNFPGLASSLLSETQNNSGGANLLPYEAVGGGVFNIPVSSVSGIALAGGGGNISSSQNTFGTANATVKYFYDDGTVTTPEPAAMALLGIGMLGLGALRRRRR